MRVDLALSDSTIMGYVSKLRKFLSFTNKPIDEITKDDVRNFLEAMKEKYALNSYCNFLKALSKLFKDYLGKPELSNFKYPSIPFKPKMLNFEKADLGKFYNAIENTEVQMLFLGYCVTGLRRDDLLYLEKSELNTEKRMIIKNNGSQTKHRWISFYNEELANLLHPYLEAKNNNNDRVFSLSRVTVFDKYWYNARSKTKIDITSKDLRTWFCVEMTNLGVPDKFIDAFCGRTPKTVLAKHYTDYSPKRLKAIYDKAQLRILS